MKRWTGLLVLVLIAFVSFSEVAKAEITIPPRPSSSLYVQDFAGVLSENAKNSIRSRGTQLASKTGAQVIVVIVPSLGGANPEEYGLGILRQWGIGSKKLNNGVVLLVSPQEHVSRIEVGYGLEGALPDAKTGRLQDENMLPFFAKGDYETGIVNGYMALTAVVAKEYNIELKTGESSTKKITTTRQVEGLFDQLPLWVKLSVMLGIVALLFIDWIFLGGNVTTLLLTFLLLGRRDGNGNGNDNGGGGDGGGGGSNRNW